MKTLVITGVFTLITTLSLLAQEGTPRVNNREANQRGRIAQGRNSGEVTRGEAAHLNRQQRHIHRTERRAKADGNVTRAERKRLKHEQNRASRNINRSKNNSIDKN